MIRHKHFRFSNYIVFKDQFHECVAKGWDVHIEGHSMFRVVKRMRLLKKPLLREAESLKLKEFNEALLEEERYLQQKSKVEWLKVGDSNSAYFHKFVKGRTNRSRINAVMDHDGIIKEGKAVPDVFFSHYTNFLGTSDACASLSNPDEIFTKCITSDLAEAMIVPVIESEVKNAIFSIGEGKSPEPDGYSSTFFKHSWDIIGPDVTKAIQDFFSNAQLLTEINHTVIALLPKVASPCKVTDFHPISCCNVIYKCISKIIADRIKGSLDFIVSENQSAFIPGRRISDNILIAQEIMKNYHLSRGTPRCAFKVDIQKAYDTVDWKFLESNLIQFGFHKIKVKWIMKCVTSTSYSINVNGDLHGYFKGKRGLRQGDPMSPYLFTLVMETLTLLLQRNIRNSEEFRFHPKYENQEIINVCFADDLFLFSHASIASLKVISDALSEFSNCSGLVPGFQKSTSYFCNVSEGIKSAIKLLLPFDEGLLPVIYLRVPLISSRLMIMDCKVLVDRVKVRIDNWKNKFLSYAGRVQLITSVLSSMFHASILGPLGRGKAKDKWSEVCLPKSEGGLGIRSLKYWNMALMSTHVWNLITHKQTLWVRWIHSYRLHLMNFWEVDVTSDSSWGWRKTLDIRSTIRQFIIHMIGDGNDTSAWHDSWNDYGPLASVIDSRDIRRAGFIGNATVSSFLSNNSWSCPQSWYSKYPMLANIAVPDTSKHDSVRWRGTEGDLINFSVTAAWDSLRPRAPVVSWYNSVWFQQCIPRHTFVIWLLVKEKLKTHDHLKPWDKRPQEADSGLACLMCERQPESQTRLFFECPFASQVWGRIKGLCLVHIPAHDWRSFLSFIEHVAHRRVARVIVAKLVFAASVYFIWQERNNRYFQGKARSEDQVFKIIFSMVRMKLMSLNFKDSEMVRKLRSKWQIV
ncbi:uncharacterized protein [Rutidosis leptorrhynchoides]|uniref:uncharacterized protein n=1 Tax=Rutidosis leptorrhynchoides TaxID=125765 RepID=UPI003A9A090B